MPITLRQATPSDARFLALTLMEAMGGEIMERLDECSVTADDEKRLAMLTSICERDDTLYTWRYGTIAQTADGIMAGASIAYPGAEYHQRRLVSFSLVKEIITFDIHQMEDESEAGEFYLDTLAVLPAFRRQGVAHALMQHWLLQAQESGLTATLACSTTNFRAKQLYESMGLSDAGLIFIFGEYYQKMARKG